MRHTWDLVFPWGLLDGLVHLLRLPRWIRRPVCRRFDEKLNALCDDTEIVFSVNTTSGNFTSSSGNATVTWTSSK